MTPDFLCVEVFNEDRFYRFMQMCGAESLPGLAGVWADLLEQERTCPVPFPFESLTGLEVMDYQ